MDPAARQRDPASRQRGRETARPRTRRSTPATTRQEDLVTPYVDDLGSVIDLDAIRGAGLTIGVDPLGGAARRTGRRSPSRYGLDITIVNPAIDPTFGFMTLDHDGRIRMDCSSPYAMAGLVALKDRFQVACGTDPDADRHGIVTASAGLMNPNHFLAVAIQLSAREPSALAARTRASARRSSAAA